MDRYNDYETDYQVNTKSRISKNEELYQDLGRTMKYTNFTKEIPAIELNSVKKNYKTREGYQQMKGIENFFEEELPTAKKELKEFSELYDINESKVYDINSILEQAKKERTLVDEREKKRKLKNENNIAATMDEKELKAIKNRKKIFEESEKEELQELIDTITSHELREELDEAKGGLLADLMATSVDDKVEAIDDENPTSTIDLEVTEGIKKEMLPLKGITDPHLTKDLDHSFYTRSMDLSEKDFDLSDDMEDEFKESRGILFLKLFLLILLLVVVVVGSYFIVKSF